MIKKDTITYFKSTLVPDLLFDTEDEAREFETVLNDYLRNQDALNELGRLLTKYPSMESIRYHIDDDSMPLPEGEHSEELFTLVENAVEPENIYAPVLHYLAEKYYEEE